MSWHKVVVYTCDGSEYHPYSCPYPSRFISLEVTARFAWREAEAAGWERVSIDMDSGPPMRFELCPKCAEKRKQCARPS